MSKGKKTIHKKWMDKGITIILVAFALGVAALILFMVKDKFSESIQKEQRTASSSTAPKPTATPKPDEADLIRYRCEISEENKDSEGSEFLLVLNKKLGTYTQYLNAGETESELESGTYVQTKENITITNKQGVESLLLYDGDYLISQNAVYKGNVPKSRTFDKTFIHEVKETDSAVQMIFHKNGTFEQTIRRSQGLTAEKQEGKVKGQENKLKGTYKHKGKFIERKRENGQKLMSLYIYNNQICASYYKRIRKSEK